MIPEFSLKLICGLSLVWCLAPQSLITSGFFRIQMLIALGLSVLAFLTAGQMPAADVGENAAARNMAIFGVVSGILSFFGSFYWTLERRRVGAIFGGLIAVCSWLFLISVVVGRSASSSPVEWVAPVLDAASSAMLFGSTTAAMLLGHWYLTATGMSLAPLIRFNQFFLASVLFRIVVVATVSTSSSGSFSMSDSGLLVLRWVGLVGPLILGVLTQKILKYRNTQSATGVLYAATILVFMGEMAARLLSSSVEHVALSGPVSGVM
ncbi:hypothetical protein KOR42_17680 [Thalassoglobus neptunius]|uniref:Uncharacterized protein n=1 Tax=Thalassoglobus neptunius TaxID=1938619 RepID=A0A5C5X652_9PLAN|nr:hypothetical protein [Thalassoglobus neptunius]TWT58394.1 hypothetical protein KOR42_17680 [Thalassoglobus neptunius]